MSRPSNAVFISYRREASWTLVEALYQRLTEADIDTFYDIESLRAGEFERVILNQIRARPYFLLVLTPGTLERCADEGDWLGREIDTAVTAARIVVPVHTPSFDLSSVERLLPPALGRKVAASQAVELPHKYFRFALQRLIEEYLVPVTVDVDPTPDVDRAHVERMQRAAAKAPARNSHVLASSRPHEHVVFELEQLGYRLGSPYLNETSPNIYYADDVIHKKPRVVFRGDRIRIEKRTNPEQRGMPARWQLWKSFSLAHDVEEALATIRRMKGRPSKGG